MASAVERRKPSIAYENIGAISYGSTFALPPEEILPAGIERKGPGRLEEHITRPVPHRGWKYDYRSRRAQTHRDPLEDHAPFPSGKAKYESFMPVLIQSDVN
jgi:hypothetical protein